MNKELLITSNEEVLLGALRLLKGKTGEIVKLAMLQEKLQIGFARGNRILDLLEAAGITHNDHKYKLVMGVDHKWHRRYLPPVLVASEEELDECIAALEAIRQN